MRRVILAFGAILVVGISACGSDKDGPDEIDVEDAALRVMVDVQEQADVASAQLSVRRCASGEEVASKRASLKEWSHEAMAPAYAESNGHLFLEHYVELAAGCYDVEMTFFTNQGVQSSRCTTAVGKSVEVTSGNTHEILLYSRCDGIDDAPVVEMIAFDPTVLLSCDESVSVCATVRHLGDVKMSWAHYDGAPLSKPIRVDEMTKDDEHQRMVQCTQWHPYYQGETTGRMTATPAWAETIDDGHEVLFAERHQVHFGIYMECPDRQQKAGILPPISRSKDKKWKAPKFPGLPEIPEIPKFPKDSKYPPGDDKYPKPPEQEDESLRVIASMNRPPHLTSVDYEPSKLLRCPARVTLCASAQDMDGDPMRFVWRQVDGPAVVAGPTRVKSTGSKGSLKECVEYEFAHKGAFYNFEVTVYDLFYDEDQDLISAEEWFFENLGEWVKSRASMELPVHVGCDLK